MPVSLSDSPLGSSKGMNENEAIRELAVIRGNLSAAMTRLFKVMETSGELPIDKEIQGKQQTLGIHLFSAVTVLFVVNDELHAVTNELRVKAGLKEVEPGVTLQVMGEGIHQTFKEALVELCRSQKEKSE